MALGTNKTRNWGKDAQLASLCLILKSRKVAYRVVNAKCRDGLACKTLWLAASADGVTLPFVESAAELVNTRRGRWEARHPFDDRLLASGVSERDVIRATIERIWN